MKKLLWTPLVLICLNQLNAQIVDIPDPELKKILVSDTNVNTNMNAEIEVSEASAFTGRLLIDTFRVNLPIENLKGLEAFTKIESLVLGSFTNTNVDLSANTELKRLDIVNNYAFVRGFNVKLNIDLSNNTKLETLNIDVDEFESLNLANNTALQSIILIGDSLDTLDTSKLLSLEDLAVSANRNLTELNLANNSALKTLILSRLGLTEIDVTNNTALREVSIGNIDIEAIDVSKNTELRSLTIANAKLKTLDVSNSPNLEILFVKDNELTSLNVANGANDLLNTAPRSGFFAKNNPDLLCVQIDSGFVVPVKWEFDSQTSFSSDCGSVGAVLSVNDVETSNSASEISWSTNNITIASTSAVKSASIYSIAGKDVINSTSKSIDIASLQSGIYILSLTNEEGARENFKFIKE